MRPDSYSLKQWWLHVREDFFGTRSRDFIVFLFFVGLSFGFWLLQAMDETFEAEIVVPIELTDVPEDVVITTPLPEEIQVIIKDKGSALVRQWRHRQRPITISYSNYATRNVNGAVRIPHADVQRILQQRLSASTRIQTIRPDTLEFFYNHGRHATVPVLVTGSVETDTQHYLLSLESEPREVRVFASASVLDTLTAIRTQPLSLTNLHENTTAAVDLVPIRGAKLEPSRVRVRATLDVYMENTLEIPIVSTNFPADRQLRTFPHMVKVTYTVGYARSREVSRLGFLSVVTYEDVLALQEHGENKIPVQLRNIPEGVTVLRIEPAEVDYLVETVNESE